MLFKVIITILAVVVTVFLLIFLFPIVKVEGDSMFPTFREGRILWCRRLFFFNKDKCKKGKIYVIHLKDEEDGSPYFIVKRLKYIYPYKGKYANHTLYDFRGDNIGVSYDSRQHGWFDSSEVVAKVIGNFPNKYESYQKGENNESKKKGN